MLITSSVFVKSSPNVAQCPPPNMAEYAFWGRSNVGKSTLINYLCGHKGLAKVSGTPGKTVIINHFLINNKWYLVDLPGYGYAQRSKKMRAQWENMIYNYLLKRKNLQYIFLLIDGRHSMQKNDKETIFWLGKNQVPFVIVFTKTDKISTTELASNIQNYKKELEKDWENLPELLITSAKKDLGKNELTSFIDQWNHSFDAQL